MSFYICTAVLATFVTLSRVPVDAHSWVVKVGDAGRSRGGVVGSDGELQRYFCPKDDLDLCQPEDKHNVVLTNDALRPCRAGVTSNPMAQVAAGEDMPMSWMGNGHVNNGQSDDTCVRIGIAPYASDPSFADFLQIGDECIEYWKFDEEGNAETKTSIQIPADTPAGQYTVFWYWNFLPFWFSSCADIVVTNGPGAPTPAPPSPGPLSYLQDGCAELDNAFCSNLRGGSYCKSYQSDECGRSICHGDSFSVLNACDDDDDDDVVGAGPGNYNANGCAGLASDFCSIAFGTYCKDYQTDGCGRAVCHGQSHSSLDPCP